MAIILTGNLQASCPHCCSEAQSLAQHLKICPLKPLEPSLLRPSLRHQGSQPDRQLLGMLADNTPWNQLLLCQVAQLAVVDHFPLLFSGGAGRVSDLLRGVAGLQDSEAFAKLTEAACEDSVVLPMYFDVAMPDGRIVSLKPPHTVPRDCVAAKYLKICVDEEKKVTVVSLRPTVGPTGKLGWPRALGPAGMGHRAEVEVQGCGGAPGGEPGADPVSSPQGGGPVLPAGGGGGGGHPPVDESGGQLISEDQAPPGHRPEDSSEQTDTGFLEPAAGSRLHHLSVQGQRLWSAVLHPEQMSNEEICEITKLTKEQFFTLCRETEEASRYTGAGAPHCLSHSSRVLVFFLRVVKNVSLNYIAKRFKTSRPVIRDCVDDILFFLFLRHSCIPCFWNDSNLTPDKLNSVMRSLNAASSPGKREFLAKFRNDRGLPVTFVLEDTTSIPVPKSADPGLAQATYSGGPGGMGKGQCSLVGVQVAADGTVIGVRAGPLISGGRRAGTEEW